MRVCSAEFMKTDAGLGFASEWLPRVVAERFLTSVKDGPVDRAPDPVPFITGDLTYVNNSDVDQHLTVSVHKASRTLVTSNPNMVALDDAVSWDVGLSPSAPLPVAVRDGVGMKLKWDRQSEQTMNYARLFQDYGDSIFYEEIGKVEPGESLQFRYRCLFSTPGTWKAASQPRYEAYARWTRLRAFASPMTTTV